MENPWEHIKDNIRNQESPLSEGAWEGMSTMLGPKKKAVSWQYGLLAVLFAGIASLGVYKYQYQETETKEEAQSEVIKSDETQVNQTTRTSSDMRDVEFKLSGSKSSTDLAGENSLDEESLATNAVVTIEEAKENNQSANTAFTDAEQLRDQQQEPAEQDWQVTLEEKKLDLETGESNAQARFDEDSYPKPQTEKMNQGIFKGAEIKLFVASTYNMPNLTYTTTGDDVHKGYSQAIHEGVKADWGYDVGVEISLLLFDHLRVNTGIGFREIVTQNSLSYSIDEIPVIDSATGNILAYLDDNTPLQVSDYSKNSFTYLNVPISLFYEWPVNNRWSITGEAIHNFSFLLNEQGSSVNTTTLLVENDQLEYVAKSINSYQLKLGVRYALTQNLALALEPAYRNYYQDFYTQGPVSWKPSDFSLSLSAIIKLK